MEKYIEHIALINQFIKGLLSKKEIEHFENKLESDAIFKTTYNEHLVFLEGLQRKAIKLEINTARKGYMKQKWFKIVSVSLAVVVVPILVYILFFKAENSETNQPIKNNDNIEVVSDSIVVEKSIESQIEISDAIENTSEVSVVKKKVNRANNQVSSIQNKEEDTTEVVDFTKEVNEVFEPESLRPELIALYDSVKKTPEIFEINNEKAITITCKEGTTLTIPAKAFIDAKTGQIARGLIKLEITEYYKLSDMLLANLTTKSDEEILETGGMLYIDANKKDSKLKLKPGKHIQITFNNNDKKNMQLFSGEEIANTVNWKLEDNKRIHFNKIEPILRETLEENVQVPLEYVEEVPVFPGCENGTKSEKKKCFTDNIKSLIEKNFNKSIAEELNLIGNHRISISFIINREGQVFDIKARAAHIALGQEAVRVVELLPKMLPARQRGKTVFVPYGLPIYLSIGESTKNNPALVTVNGKRKNKTQFESTIENRLNTKDSSFSNGTLGKPITVNEISRYAFSISQLGWINCDRFVRIKNKLKFKIKIKDANGANVKMVFKSLSSILPSKSYDDEFDFGAIPANEKVTIVAIKEKDGVFYLAIKDTEIKSDPKLELEFKPVTINQLKEALIQLNEGF